MSNTNKKNETKHQLYDEVMKNESTSAKIRALLKHHDVKTTHKLINQFGVTTKNGGPIIYQFVRNVANQKVGNN